MQPTLRLMIAAIVAVALTHLIGVAAAQNAVKQIKLTDQQIEPPDNARICRISNHLFRGVARLGPQPMILLDAEQLLH